MRRSLTMVLALVVAGSLLLAGCGDDEEKVESKPAGDGGKSQPVPPEEEPTTAGPIDSIQLFEPITEGCMPPEELDPDGSVSSDDPPICTPADADTLVTFLIAPGTGTGEVDAASVTVSKETALLKSDGTGGWLPGRYRDLVAGVEVRVWSGGAPMAQSYPVQFEAATVAYGAPESDDATGGSGTPTSPSTVTTGPPSTDIGPPATSPPGGGAGLPTEPPTSTGTVTAVEPCPEFNPNTPGTCADELISTVQVDTSGGQGPALAVRLTARTTVLTSDGTVWSNGSVNDVKPGAGVRVWVEGGRLTKSIPAQGDAAVIAVG